MLLQPRDLNRHHWLPQEFNQKRRPVYKQRGDVISQVPRFWAQALVNHPGECGIT